MRKETITYTDYDGETRTEDFFFNLNKAEILELELSWDGGMRRMLQKIVNEKDQRRMIEMFKMIIAKAYGEKSMDGKKFVKTDENGRSLFHKNFEPTEAYSDLFIKLSMDEKAASDFINGIIPKNLDEKAASGEASKVLPGPGAETK